VATEARAGKGKFTDLVQQYSDGYDVISNGDFGSWSTYERNDPLLMNALSALKIGESSQPIEAFDGFHILQRTPDITRPVLAISHLVVSYDSASEKEYRPPIKRSKQEAQAVAEQLLHELAEKPDQFDSVRREHCDVPWFCGAPIAATAGRGVAGIDAAINQVAIGNIAPTVFETPLGFHLVRREDPAKYPAQRVSATFEFPHPAPRDLNWILANAPGPQLATETKQLSKDAAAALKLDGADANYFKQILNAFADHIASAPASERAALAQATHQELRSLLGDARWRVFQSFENSWVLRRQGL
jgi:hypothetical protein